MDNLSKIKSIAKTVIKIEAGAIAQLEKYIDTDFENSVRLILACGGGRVIITGIGKSAIIASKIAATMNSTGTPAVFLHAADAIHGDLGIITPKDIVICLSKSGNTPEIKVLIPLIRNFGNKIIAIVSDANSFLAKNSDLVIRATIEKEACPNNLAPTSSTTAQLVMGDALAVALLESRNFTGSDFAKFHPGGALGKKLYLRASDLYLHNEKPEVRANDTIEKVILEISSKRLGAAAVTNSEGHILGIITDGDLRRMLAHKLDINKVYAEDIMSKQPKTVLPEAFAVNIFEMMKANDITQVIVSKSGNYLGIIHLHDILKEGIV